MERCLLSLLLVAMTGCIVTRAPAPGEGAASAPPADIDWGAGALVPYRLVTKADFKATSSNSMWGNVAHGAEICTTIVAAEQDDAEGQAFRAMMLPECSFWNKIIGPLGKLMLMTAAVVGIPMVAPNKQPDWYILQHEQIHFAINEVAARQASEIVSRLPSEKRTGLAPRVLEITLQKAHERHAEFDSETSGAFDRDKLEKWVSVLELQMSELCGSGPHCEVRTAD
jgi:hypothetical protein